MLTSCPAAASARGNAPTTSAKPPVLEKGTHSEATNAMCMSRESPSTTLLCSRYDSWRRETAGYGSQSSWRIIEGQ